MSPSVPQSIGNPNSVDLATKSKLLACSRYCFCTDKQSSRLAHHSLDQWCQGELATCPTLCGGVELPLLRNLTVFPCELTTLLIVYFQIYLHLLQQLEPSILCRLKYTGTLPDFICEASYQQCLNAHPDSSTCQTCSSLVTRDVGSGAPISSAATFTTQISATQISTRTSSLTNIFHEFQTQFGTVVPQRTLAPPLPPKQL